MATSPKKTNGDLAETTKNPVMPRTMSELEDILNHATPDDLAEMSLLLNKYLPVNQVVTQVRAEKSKDTELSPSWRDGGYPYKNRLSRKNYEAQKYKLQIELLKLQHHVKATWGKSGCPRKTN